MATAAAAPRQSTSSLSPTMCKANAGADAAADCAAATAALSPPSLSSPARQRRPEKKFPRAGGGAGGGAEAGSSSSSGSSLLAVPRSALLAAVHPEELLLTAALSTSSGAIEIVTVDPTAPLLLGGWSGGSGGSREGFSLQARCSSLAGSSFSGSASGTYAARKRAALHCLLSLSAGRWPLWRQKQHQELWRRRRSRALSVAP